jgi:hypothetical protein
MQVVCLGCKESVELPDVRQPQIVNMPSVSILVLEHPQQGMCPRCLTPITATMMGAQLALAAAPVPAEVQQSIVLAPNGLRVN